MDYTSYFPAAAPSPYTFIGLPPTPSYDDGGKLGELGPVDIIDPSFLPPYDAFPSFNPAGSFHTDLAASPPAANSPPAAVSSMDGGPGADVTEASGGRTRSSSEEKETLTPAQSRRKAQNRAAQRAFRERKERHVKDLEAKLSALESSASSLQSDNERLKQLLQRAKTENELLRASSSTSSSTTTTTVPPSDSTLSTTTSTSTTTSADPTAALLLPSAPLNPLASSPHPRAPPPPPNLLSHTRASADGATPLSAGAAWDLIQSHPLVRQGLVDIGDVCERLRLRAKCDGSGGPGFGEGDVRWAVEEGRRVGGDELI